MPQWGREARPLKILPGLPVLRCCQTHKPPAQPGRHWGAFKQREGAQNSSEVVDGFTVVRPPSSLLLDIILKIFCCI